MTRDERDPYRPDQRALQDRFDTRRMADRLTVMTTDALDDAHRAFIEARETFFLSTVDEDGWPQCYPQLPPICPPLPAGRTLPVRPLAQRRGAGP